MRNSFMTGRQPKMRQRDMQFTFWNNAISRFAISAKSVSSRLLSLRSMRNCLGTGGSKDQFSWNNSFATQQTNEISGSQCRVNIWPRIRRSKSLSPLLPRGVRTAISLCGSIGVTPGFIRSSMRQPCGCVKSRDDMRQTARNAQTLATAYSNNSPVSFCWHNQVTGRF